MTTFFELKANLRPNAPRRRPASDAFTATESRRLAEAVQAAVYQVDEGTLEPVARPDNGQIIRPKLLLALLTFCYARQIFGFAEIVEWVRRNVHFRQVILDELPDERTLCRFRRENREPLHRCLTATLRFLVEQKVAAGIVTKVSETQLAEEASRRIITALFIDGHEREGEAADDAPVDLCYLFAKGRALAH